jgi:hypothetical protein
VKCCDLGEVGLAGSGVRSARGGGTNDDRRGGG